MLILGVICLGLFAFVAFVIYLSVMFAIWLIAIIFIAFAWSISSFVGDPYLGALIAIPMTALVVWGFVKDKKCSK